MPWPRVVEPSEVQTARWWFTPEGGWNAAQSDPRAHRAIDLLLSNPDYWDLHAYATAFWSQRYGRIRSRATLLAAPPSVTVPELAQEDYTGSRLADYSEVIRARLSRDDLHQVARELLDRIYDPAWLDQASIVTVDEIDQLIEECRRRYPDSREDFERCIRGEIRRPE
jgi:hypothetical protein